MNGRKFSRLSLWLMSLIITLIAAMYQRATGPTYPVRGAYQIDRKRVSFHLKRSHSGMGGLNVSIPVPARGEGVVIWRRYPTSDPWQRIDMTYHDGRLEARLPHQPPAGKVEYHVELMFPRAKAKIVLPGTGRNVVARYKGDVPASVLVPHIILMFAGMLYSTRAALAVLFGNGETRRYTIPTFLLLVLGGLVFGCTVQYYAFGKAWTGFPYGHDLTDNKLGIAVLAWVVPFIQALRRQERKYWVLAASVVTFVIFLIPHSVLGSQLDYSKISNGITLTE